MHFYKNSSDNHNLASIARNNTKLNIRYTYCMALHSRNLRTNSWFGGSVMPLWIDFHQTEYMRWIVLKPLLFNNGDKLSYAFYINVLHLQRRKFCDGQHTSFHCSFNILLLHKLGFPDKLLYKIKIFVSFLLNLIQ